jgi:alpha-tubulin suppressor-like RCC1 family protein
LIVNASSVSYVATNSGGNISNGGDGIAGSSDAFCSLTENGTVVCWGQNEHGRINATASTSDSLEPTIVPMPLGRFATGVAVGIEAACALLDNSSVVCWGDSNESRILSHWAGDGIITPRFIPGLSGSASVIQLQVNYDTACVLLSDGDMKCWGLGVWGNLGQGNTTSLALPTSVSILPSTRSVVQIAVGTTHTCALLDNNSLMCFGDNDYYQLGDGTTTYRPFGVYVGLGTRTISTVGAGWLGTCVAYQEGGASCWGRNDNGMVGDGTTTARSTPVNVTGLGANTTFARLSLMFGETCGIATNGSLLCWGNNNGFQAADSYTPGIVDVGTNVSTVSVALDTDTACALLSTGEIQCWGYSGGDENFGLNSTSSSSTPVRGVTNETHRTINGGWNIVGTLPQGLQFSPVNGTIWGTPVVVQPQWTNYTVKVYNSAGSSTYTFSIRVIDALPNVTYAPSNLTLTNNTVSSDLPLVPTLTGAGEISSWAINASLPAGLTFGTNNGTIWGTPTELWTQTSYMVWANNTGGSSLAYLNITVNDQLPTNLTYTPENLTLVRGEVSSDLPLVPSLTGPGDITSWAINASLPSGLSFGTNNGTIWGVPSVNMTTTTYTVWANNSGGSVSTSINITVLEPAVGLEYNPENITLIRGVQMATLSPTLTGGLASSWNITPALPSGLLFIDGVISGTPTVNMTATMYTVWANNTGGDVSHTINITILEPSGNLSYSPENITLTRGVTMSPLHPTYSGGAVENWSIHPALPAGLNFSNGVISGTPTVNMTTTMFTLYANNTGGSAAATINITILEPVVDLLYSPNNLTLMRGTTMPPLHPIVSGGNVSEWALVGVLPEGLNFSNGVFSGTPLVNMTQTQYLVYANTTGGSAIAWINITVLEPAVNLSYNPYNLTLTRNVTMNPLTPIVSGGNVSNWSIFPELPAGLDFTNGTISGTSEVNLTTTMFTVWANTSGGATSTTVNITVLEPVVDFLYSPNAIVLTRNETMNATSPVFGDDAMAEEWGISPALPEGLNFSNGTISGTPLVNLTATVFTIYANNSGGSVMAFLTITVLEPVATVVYVPENITLTRGEDNASLVPLLAGGMVASWSISPDLPEGLVFDNGSITGVPLVNMTNTTFTVMALNSGGMAFAFLNITVVEPVAVLAFNESFLGTRGETLFNATVENTGGTVATWAIEPALPSGVSFTNGRLFGVAQANLSETVFTLWANNSGGSVNLTFTLVVLEPVANISYPVGDMTLIRSSSRSNLRPLVEGGVPETWEIEPALPEGLRLVNGFVIGVPLGLIDETTFTVWANNSGGSASATFTLTVNQPTYLARYPVTRVVLEVNETMAPVFPIYYFGSAQQPDWAISPELPEGLVFFDGRISGTPTVASNETNYTVTVTGDMVPVELFIIIEVRGEPDLVVENIRNATEEEVFSLPDLTPEDDSFDMYWACFPLLLLVTLMGVAAINNFLALTAKDEEDEDEEGPENEGNGSD